MPLVEAREATISEKKRQEAFSQSISETVDIIVVPAIGASLGEVRRRLFRSETPFRTPFYERIDKARVRIFDFPIDDNSNKKDCLEYYAASLLGSILQRKDVRGPIHFVGHSTGGLVVKKALILAHRSPKYSIIWAQCLSVAFFGVPHQGSTILSDAPFSISVERNLVLKERVSPELRRILAPESEELTYLGYDFAPVARRLKRIYTFIETQDTPLEALAASSTSGDIKVEVRFPIVDGRSATLHHGNEIVLAMDRAHAELLDLDREASQQHAHTYLQGLQQLSGAFFTYSNDLDAGIRQSIHADLHLFYVSTSASSRPSIKVWSVYPTLENLLATGPNQCFRKRLEKRSESVDKAPDPSIPTPKPLNVPNNARRPSIANIDVSSPQDAGMEDSEVPSILVRPPTPPESDLPTFSIDGGPMPPVVPVETSEAQEKDGDANDASSINLIPSTRIKNASEEEQKKGYIYYKQRLERGNIFRLPDASQRLFRWIHLPCNVMTFVPDIMQCLKLDTDIQHLYDTLLLEDNFDAKQSVARHGRSHSRCMKPGCKYFPGKSEGSASDQSNPLAASQLCIFLPYLHWDSFKSLMIRNDLLRLRAKQKHVHPIEPNIRHGHSMEHKLIWQYMNDNGNLPIHHRRSLDQYGYPNLRSTQARDEDQILYKRRTSAQVSFPLETPLEGRLPSEASILRSRRKSAMQASMSQASKLKDDGGKVLMVDQLWCWITDPTTVMTFFTPKEEEKDDHGSSKLADLRNSIYNDVNGDPRFATQCHDVLDFGALVVHHAISVFLEKMENEDLQVFRVFEEYISILTELHTKSFKAFRDLYHERGAFSGSRAPGRTKSEALSRQQHADLLANEHDLTALLELRDVEDELTTLDKLFRDQARVLQEMITEFNKIRPGESQGRELLLQSSERVSNYRDMIRDMLTNCKSAQDAYTRLLDLKQKQASVAEAWAAREANEVASSQNRAVMIFTIFTIIFLPLSFFTSLFGMNARAWSGVKQNVSLHVILLWMLPVSAAVTLFALLAAFNEFFRAQLVWLTHKLLQRFRWLSPPHDLEKGTGARRKLEPSVSAALQAATVPASVMATELGAFAGPRRKTVWKIE